MEAILAMNIIEWGPVSIQEVIYEFKGKTFLSNVNILMDDKCVKKLRFKPGQIIFEKGVGKNIVAEHLHQLLKDDTTSERKKGQARSKKNVNKRAANKVAKDLLGQIK